MMPGLGGVAILPPAQLPDTDDEEDGAGGATGGKTKPQGPKIIRVISAAQAALARTLEARLANMNAGLGPFPHLAGMANVNNALAVTTATIVAGAPWQPAYTALVAATIVWDQQWNAVVQGLPSDANGDPIPGPEVDYTHQHGVIIGGALNNLSHEMQFPQVVQLPW